MECAALMTAAFPLGHNREIRLMQEQNLYFVRGTVTFDPQTCFETWTDVWVFGDVRGYLYARSMILDAKGSAKAIRLHAIPHDSHSMRVLILPANRRVTARPRVKLAERLIWDSGRLKMELVVYGNPAGYDRLAAVFKRSADDPGDASNHEHIDDSTMRGRWLVPRSVSLNVRSPLPRWDLESLGPYKTVVANRQKDFLPDSRLISVAPERYQPISAEDCVRLRLA